MKSRELRRKPCLTIALLVLGLMPAATAADNERSIADAGQDQTVFLGETEVHGCPDGASAAASATPTPVRSDAPSCS